jgi:hypothetical protein
MKPLEQLINVEKGKLVHELFPDEMPALLQHIKETGSLIDRDKDEIKAHWENGLLTADFWFTLSNNANRIIDKYGAKLEKSSRLFADQLFDGYTAIYTVECIVKYASSKAANKKFMNAVAMLFM